jgi:hypothetical protein
MDLEGFDLLIQFLNVLKRAVLFRLCKNHIKADDFGSVLGENVHQGGYFRPRPWPSSFRLDALFIDHGQNNLGCGFLYASGLETEIKGFQFHEIQEGDPGEEKKEDQDGQ